MSRRKKARRSAGENDAGEQGTTAAPPAVSRRTCGSSSFWSHATNLVPGDWNGQPDIFMGDLDFVYTLPAANWTAKLEKGTVAGWTYKDAKRLAGPIGSIVVQPGKSVVVKGKGADLGFQLPTDPKPVRVPLVIGDGALRYCGLFGGTTSFKPGTQYKATKAPAPAGCDE